MNSGRSNKPLFEVLSQHPPRGTEQHGSRPESAEIHSAQVAVPEPKPTRTTSLNPASPNPTPSKPISPKPAQRAPEPQTDQVDPVEQMDPAESMSRPVVTIPQSTVYTALAFAGALVLIAWIFGYRIGAANKESELIRDNNPPNILNEPGQKLENSAQLADPEPTIITQNPGPIQDPASTVLNSPAGTSLNASATGTILSAAGLIEVDPREPGLNYLVLGTFSREMTQDAIEYLALSNLWTIGVPQPSGEYRLISIGLGVPGGSQFSAMSDQRIAHKRAIEQVGARWMREEQGGSDFSQTQWTKYLP